MKYIPHQRKEDSRSSPWVSGEGWGYPKVLAATGTAGESGTQKGTGGPFLTPHGFKEEPKSATAGKIGAQRDWVTALETPKFHKGAKIGAPTAL